MTLKVNVFMQLAQGLCFCLITFCQYSIAASTDQSLDTLFIQGQEQYENSNYDSALEIFEMLIDQAPDISTYHHWSGKCYGRIAEQANWLKAISFSKKTLTAFETAVELDPANLSALSDLMAYYESAPKFLGGSKKKAALIAKRIKNVEPIEIIK